MGAIDMVGHARPTPTRERLLARVTFHAVTRYVQRVLGVEVTVDEADLPNNKNTHPVYIAERHAAAVGMTVEAIKELIMVPAVAAASITGMSRVYTAEFKAMINPQNGTVVTICDRKGAPPKKVKHKSHEDPRRYMRRADRAERSKRASKRLKSGAADK